MSKPTRKRSRSVGAMARVRKGSPAWPAAAGFDTEIAPPLFTAARRQLLEANRYFQIGDEDLAKLERVRYSGRSSWAVWPALRLMRAGGAAVASPAQRPTG